MYQDFKSKQVAFEATLNVGSTVHVRFSQDQRVLIAQAHITKCNTDSFEVRMDIPFLRAHDKEQLVPAGKWLKIQRLGSTQNRVEPIAGY